jgi:DNA-binding XRE family transcriptional regulator
MAKKFRDLTANWPPERLARVEARVQKTLAEMRLRELRKARRLSQVALAKKLKAQQATISKLERRADMYVSSLRQYIGAMGGELEIIARFPEGAVRINQFQDLK